MKAKRPEFDVASSSHIIMIESNGQATGGICNLDYRRNAWRVVELEQGLSLELRRLDV